MSNTYDIKTFQGLILTLQDYWSRQGCMIAQPFDMEVGAGTSHPMTFLRAIGPEPHHCAYVQPSRRPTDGRYGENPNRLQHYYQFQVVLKPSPSNIQELYLGSLKELGFDEMPVLGVHLRLPLAAYFGEGHALLDAKKEGSTICRAYLVSKEQLNALSLHLGDYGRHAIKLTGLGQGMDGYALTSAKQIPAKQPSFEYINHMLKGLEEMGNDFVDALAYISLIAGIADEIIAKHQA